jgi:hypothetical protein
MFHLPNANLHHLVQYCSEKCRDEDLEEHKLTLCDDHQRRMKEPVVEQRAGGNKWRQTKVTNSLYSSLPSHDILESLADDAWSQNEISVLLPASGDLGSLMKTILAIPKERNAGFLFNISDKNDNVALRNLLILLIIIRADNLVTASEAIVHVSFILF